MALRAACSGILNTGSHTHTPFGMPVSVLCCRHLGLDEFVDLLQVPGDFFGSGFLGGFDRLVQAEVQVGVSAGVYKEEGYFRGI